MSIDDCPSREQLRACVAGRLTRDEAARIFSHVDTCHPCETIVEEFESQRKEPIAELLSDSGSADFAADASCEVVLQEMRRLRSAACRSAASDAEDAAAASDCIATDQPLREIGRYRLLEQAGKGGMGTVYKALHKKLCKIVALKLLPAERMQDHAAVERFAREMKVVGLLDHPHIVRAMDAGEADREHFLVMEYVEGLNLSEIAHRTGPLPVADACEMIRQAALGLQDAHEQGLVHRDIKPSNLILAQRARKRPIVKILDMGLALLAEHGPAGTELTSTGQLMGTFDYMAPEQGDDTHRVDIRADIYSLGATLYRLLTGQVVYHGSSYQSRTQKLMALATKPAPPIRELRPDLPEPLAEIVHRMLEKHPSRRYSTPAEVVAALGPFCEGHDFQRLLSTISENQCDPQRTDANAGTSPYLSSFDIETDPPADRVAGIEDGLTDRLRHKSYPLRRSPWLPMTALATVVVLFALAAVITIHFAGHQSGTVSIDIDPKFRKDVSVIFSAVDGGELLEIADDDHGWKINLNEGQYQVSLGKGKERFEVRGDTVRVLREKTCVVRVQFRQEDVPPPAVLPPPIVAIADDDGKVVDRAGNTQPKAENLPERRLPFKRFLPYNGGRVHSVEFTPDGSKILTSGDNDDTVKLWRVDDGGVLATYPAKGCETSTLSDDGRLVLMGGPDLSLKVLDLKEDTRLVTLSGQTKAACGLDISPDAMLAVSGGWGGQVILWELKTGRVKHFLSGHTETVISVAFSPDQKYVLSSSYDKTLRVWEVETGNRKAKIVVFVGPPGIGVRGAEWMPDSRHVVTASGDGRLVIWDIETQKAVRQIQAHRGGATALDVSKDGRYAISGSSDGDTSVRLWNLETTEQLFQFEGHTNKVWDVQFSPDGKTAVSCGCDGQVLLWDISKSKSNAPSNDDTSLPEIYFNPVDSDHLLLSSGYDKQVRFWNVESRNLALSLPAHSAPVERAIVSKDGRFVATSGHDGLTRVWDLVRGRLHVQNLHCGRVEPIAFSPDGALLAVGIVGGNQESGTIDIVNCRDGTQQSISVRNGKSVTLDISRQGDLLAAGTGRGYTEIFELTSLRHVKTLAPEAITAKTCCVRFSPSNDSLATATSDGSITLWNTEDYSVMEHLEAEPPIERLAFSWDGRLLAAASRDALVFDLSQTTKTIFKHPSDVWGVSFSPDGNLLATGSMDGIVRLWKVETGSLVADCGKHQGWCTSVLFAPSR